jgi:hypothetical protein
MHMKRFGKGKAMTFGNTQAKTVAGPSHEDKLVAWSDTSGMEKSLIAEARDTKLPSYLRRLGGK